MPLRRRLAWLAGVLFVFLGVLGAEGIAVSRARTRASDLDLETGVTVEQTLRLRAAYADMETGQRGFIIGGSDVFLEPYIAGAGTVDRLQESLVNKTSTFDAPTFRELERVVAAGSAWRTQAQQEIDIRRSQGRVAAEAMVAAQVGKKGFDVLRRALDRLGTRLDGAQVRARNRREHHARQLVALLLAVPFAGLLFAIATGFLLNRWVVHPIGSMVDAVRRNTAGDLSANVPVGGAPDVAELGASIDAMRQTIRDRLAESEFAKEQAIRAREAIEQSTVVTLQLRAELASELGAFPEGWTAAADLLAAEGWVAGDCYDVTLVSPHLMGVIVLDIAGHGAAQAVIALKCKEILRAALRVAMAPGDALNLLADQVGSMHPLFLTAFVALIDTTTGACRYANAGHPPPLLAVHEGLVHELEPTGPLLGAFPATWRTADAQIEPGGKLVVYTDGLTEARDAGDGFYGTERLASLVITLPCEEAEPVIKACFADLHLFSPARLIDDVTMVLVCRACVRDEPKIHMPWS